ncbi:hypothetical protein QRY02_07405 [Amycolatopsis sp. DG1A-15b]|nr:hypothetical protein [Amycolatopsis sp. DG1A-15b]WIX93361.1 hypothetical protein QRY02_07405 [Amycolatopsis sp. DG1A-15b]
MRSRAKDGKPAARATFSPSIPALVEYLHSRGLKIGFSSGTGAKTCSRQAAGSLGHEDLDARTFAGWGADYATATAGGWNMPGSFTFSYPDTAERRAKLGRGAVLNAPLVADMAPAADTTLPAAELNNPDIIAVDRDWAGVGGHKVRDTGWTEVWTKPMSDGSAVDRSPSR